MNDVKMLVSGFLKKDDRKIVRVFFSRGEDSAEGILPDGRIERSKGFTKEETEKLESFLRANSKDILKQAGEVDPFRKWLEG